MFSSFTTVIVLLSTSCLVHSYVVGHKRSTASVADDGVDENYQLGVKYDEYPMVVPKRAALLLDRLMVALQHALDEDRDGANVYGAELMQGRGQRAGRLDIPALTKTEFGGDRRLMDRSGDTEPKSDNRIALPQEETMDLQRRGHGGGGAPQKGRVYWRCYFNAVTCFRRK